MKPSIDDVKFGNNYCIIGHLLFKLL